ncbi:McrA protein [Bacillus spizizenii]|nr:McrA protein [Bacillus spizizenii]
MFKDHPLGTLVRHKIKKSLFKDAELDQKIYHIVGSVGQGRWAEVPWISVFIKNLTISATRGYYIVYLFNADGSGFYVSLNQGWTYFKDKYGTKLGKEKIKKTASIIREKLNTIPKNMNLLNIDLKGKGDLARGYELGHICGRYYDVSNIPSKETFITDLQELLITYKEIEGLIGQRSIEQFNDFILLQEDGLYMEDTNNEEQYQLAVQHFIISESVKNTYKVNQKKERPEPIYYKGGQKQWTRNASLASMAMMLSNYTCEIDDSHKTFISKSTNKPFVECHHLVPIAKQDDFQYDLDQLENLVSLCPLCHRLIHLGRDEDKEKLLKKLFDQRKDQLKRIGIEITFSDLKEMYGCLIKSY